MCYGVEFDKATVCSRQGSCIGIDQCACNDGWTGHDCSVAYCFDVMFNETSVVCSGHGSCIAPDNCTCDDRKQSLYSKYRPMFGVYSNDTSVCSGHGSCFDEDQSTCDNGWMDGTGLFDHPLLWCHIQSRYFESRPCTHTASMRSDSG